MFISPFPWMPIMLGEGESGGKKTDPGVPFVPVQPPTSPGIPTPVVPPKSSGPKGGAPVFPAPEFWGPGGPWFPVGNSFGPTGETLPPQCIPRDFDPTNPKSTIGMNSEWGVIIFTYPSGRVKMVEVKDGVCTVRQDLPPGHGNRNYPPGMPPKCNPNRPSGTPVPLRGVTVKIPRGALPAAQFLSLIGIIIVLIRLPDAINACMKYRDILFAQALKVRGDFKELVAGLNVLLATLRKYQKRCKMTDCCQQEIKAAIQRLNAAIAYCEQWAAKAEKATKDLSKYSCEDIQPFSGLHFDDTPTEDRPFPGWYKPSPEKSRYLDDIVYDLSAKADEAKLTLAEWNTWINDFAMKCTPFCEFKDLVWTFSNLVVDNGGQTLSPVNGTVVLKPTAGGRGWSGYTEEVWGIPLRMGVTLNENGTEAEFGAYVIDGGGGQNVFFGPALLGSFRLTEDGRPTGTVRAAGGGAGHGTDYVPMIGSLDWWSIDASSVNIG